MIETRWSEVGDAEAIAEIFASSWRFTYRGVIPSATIERRVAANGPARWRRWHQKGGTALLVTQDGLARGFATLGSCRGRSGRPMGEIYELYLDPVCHGAGFGRRLFEAARAELRQRGLKGLVVWSLAENEVGRRFYRALKGEEAARSRISLSGASLEQVAFVWP